ncbi:GNAT family N-acetyltransferase [Spirillospora sp. NBC_01491]|uniref:GNAT family N-acetyltransferase n=1 Tax=Spirillospora sp. NBC_01491 TaxID=2976007 RepID=UPI002E342B6C|nr:GNAT family protein [Spirillospora sp. NBC_01491]
MPRPVRLAVPGDAAALLGLQHVLDDESRFMLFEPDERDHDPARLRHRLEAQAGGTDPSYTFVADAEGTDEALAGYVGVTVSPLVRSRRTGYVVMGVRASHARRGIGRALLGAAAEAARRRGLRRLELVVMTHNHAALNLYLTCGFVVEGLRRSGLEIDGRPVDQYHMGLLF